MSSVDPAKTNEAGGLQGTAQNLGASLGTALIGSVLIAALTSGLISRLEQNPAVPPPVRAAVAEIAEKGIPVVCPSGTSSRPHSTRDFPPTRGRRSPTITATPSSTA